MTARDTVAAVLLVIGCLGLFLTALGLLLDRNVYNKIHFLAPASLIGGLFIPAAVLVREGFSQAGTKSVLIAVLLVLANPVLSHATARAARIRRKGQWAPTAGEHFPVAQEEQAP